jgi:hypothetical protein
MSPSELSTVAFSSYSALAMHIARRLDFEKLRWRHHALGMLQAELDEEVRVHFWHPCLVSIGPETARAVHDHRFDLLSAVLAGRIVDEPIAVSEWRSDIGEATEMWAIDHAKVQVESGESGSIFLGKVFHCPKHRCVRSAGTSYRIERRTFHRTIVTEPAVALVYRSNFDKDPARVLGHGGGGIVRYEWMPGGFAKVPQEVKPHWSVSRAFDECRKALDEVIG